MRDLPGEPIVTLTFREPAAGAHAFLVLDSLLDGRGAGGGVRMMPGVTLEEMKRLARVMTYKYGGIGVPSGGAKLGIVGDPADRRKPTTPRCGAAGSGPSGRQRTCGVRAACRA